MPRSETLKAVLDVARDIARRRHHSVVRAPHVLAALFAAPGMDRRIRKRGFDADHLSAAVERALEDAPETGGYRDAPTPEISSAIERAFERVEKLVDAYGAVEIVRALEDAPELRGAFRPYVLDESLVVELRRSVTGMDIAHAMTWLLARHVDLAERLADGGLDVEDLTTPCGRWFSDVVPNAVNGARASGFARVEPVLLVGHLTRDIAYAAGYELYVIGDALSVLFHGPLVAELVADEAPAEVVLLNDPMTKYGTVQHVLVEHFGKSEIEAYDLTAAIDARDEVVVARLAGAPARELASLATRTARAAGCPLRVLVRGRA
jgi:ATP-dependent Clp protease adapter protein ClpS